MQFLSLREKILIVDFGSQVTKLIGRNIRELGVYSEIISPKEFRKLKKFENIRGIIFSGGPSSVNSKKFETVPYSSQCNHGRPTFIELSLKEIEK